MDGSLQCRVVHFAGTVQGVGFRFATRRIAEDFSVVGWVRNLRDGRVEVVVQGDTTEIERFLAAIEGELGRYIDSKAAESAALDETLSKFEIRF